MFIYVYKESLRSKMWLKYQNSLQLLYILLHFHSCFFVKIKKDSYSLEYVFVFCTVEEIRVALKPGTVEKIGENVKEKQE